MSSYIAMNVCKGDWEDAIPTHIFAAYVYIESAGISRTIRLLLTEKGAL